MAETTPESTPAPAPLHPDLEPLRAFLGSWSGPGHGEYPTIEAFDYTEQLTFGHVGRPFLMHTQRTQAVSDGRPLHTETGYWRVTGTDADGGHRLELVLTQPTGIVEVHEGHLRGSTVTLRTISVGRTTTAKAVDAVERIYELDGDVLTVRLAMAAVGQPLTHHLTVALQRGP